MRKVLASIVLLCMACLNAQCQKAEVHKNDGTTVEIPVEDIDSITFSMTNPFNFETRTVKLNSGYEMPIIGIGTYLLSTAQAEESVYNALKVGMRLIDTADIYGNEVGVGRAALTAASFCMPTSFSVCITSTVCFALLIFSLVTANCSSFITSW